MYRSYKSTFYHIALILLFLIPISSEAQRDWQRLGVRKVNFTLDRDVIHVGLKDGSFSKLRLVVKGGALNMRKVVVQYGNGTRDEIEVRHNFRKGSLSRVIDLKGGNRIIRDITFWYDSDIKSQRRSTLLVYGRR